MDKWALITGASSGIGAQLARLYSKRGYCIAMAARRTDRMEQLSKKLDTKTRIIRCDVSDRAQCKKLYESVSDLNIELLINNAGFGAVGKFDEEELDRLIEMTDVNCTSLLMLTQLFLRDFKKKNKGTILNVASSAGLLPGGPNMAVYYATKAYVVSLTNAVAEELRSEGSAVKIASLCPGPVDTEFNKVAGVKFSLKGISPEYCAKCAARGLDRGELVIIPETHIWLLALLSKILPRRLTLWISGELQQKKL